MATILGLGNPLLDISVEVSDMSLCTKYGLKMGDACLAGESHQPLYHELVSAPYSPSYIAGGATQNSIRVAQWVSGNAPGFAAFVGSVGDDAFGTQLRKAAEADGVKTLYQVQPAGTKPTGTCAVVVYNTERSLCANLVAAESLSASHLDTPEVAAAVDSAKIIYTAGFPLTHDGGAESCLRLAKLAAEKKKTYAVNLSAPFLCQVPVRIYPLGVADELLRAASLPRRTCATTAEESQSLTATEKHTPSTPLPSPSVLQRPPGWRYCVRRVRFLQ